MMIRLSTEHTYTEGRLLFILTLIFGMCIKHCFVTRIFTRAIIVSVLKEK